MTDKLCISQRSIILNQSNMCVNANILPPDRVNRCASTTSVTLGDHYFNNNKKIKIKNFIRLLHSYNQTKVIPVHNQQTRAIPGRFLHTINLKYRKEGWDLKCNLTHSSEPHSTHCIIF